MKIMSRNFTQSEKILLVVLALVLFGLVYYRFVYLNIQDSISNSKAEAQSLQSEMEISQTKLAKMKKMKEELNGIKKTGDISRMESYNNSKEETAFLSDILSDTKDYNIAFADVTRNGDQIRRSFTLQYRTRNYAEAEAIMKKLCQGRYRCLIGDVNCSIAEDKVATISMTATFFETMVGGTPDSGLPKDEAETNETTTPAEDFGIDVK